MNFMYSMPLNKTLQLMRFNLKYFNLKQALKLILYNPANLPTRQPAHLTCKTGELLASLVEAIHKHKFSN